LKITDFGTAKDLWNTQEKIPDKIPDEFMGRGKTFVGTPSYVSPGNE
jgi:serine/threonine protein kinase